MKRTKKPTVRRRERDLPPALHPLAPLLYLVWADGMLTDDELEALRETAAARTSLDDDARSALRAWLDAADPPGADELTRLLEIVRSRTADGDGADDAATRFADDLLGAGLGVSAGEAARALAAAAEAGARPAADDAPQPRALDPEALNAFIDGDKRELRQRVLALLQQPAFARVDERDTHAYREVVLQWCRELAREEVTALAYPAEFGGEHDVAGSIAVFETLAYHDLSLLVKYGVQFGLFAGSIFLLGTRRHHEKHLRAAGNLELPGCFAMTETGHGSNVRDLETVARFDVATGEFVVHTPRTEARKDYIGNAALHARMAVVFAQLVTDAGSHGVHAFLVPIRDEEGATLPGIDIEDCGLKVGLNGVDNGRIRFTDVRIPRENLLDRYGAVSEGGVYSSPITSPTRRFFTMIGTLVAGRISIACASLSAGKAGLDIAVRYTAGRRQFGPEGEPEVPVLDYTTVQRELLPRLATAYALDFALKDLVRTFANLDADDAKEVETLAAALKAYASDWTAGTLQAAREACGGQGYLDVNRLGILRADTDVFTTFEGANLVLYQLVARGRLTEYREGFGELKVWNIARHLAGRAATRVTELNPIITRKTDRDHLLDPEFHAAALRYREDRLVSSLARRLKRRIDAGMDSFHALNECQDHAVHLGRAFAESFLLDRFHRGLAAAPAPLRPALDRLAALYALSRMEAGAAWFLESGYIVPAKARAIRNQVNELCRIVRPDASALTAAFGIPLPLLGAPIAGAPVYTEGERVGEKINIAPGG
jgi:acyl-CoA oxidase